MSGDIITSDRLRQSIEQIITDPPNSIGLVGERGAGKLHIARYIASMLLSVPLQRLSGHGYIYTLDCSLIGIEDIRKLQSDLKFTVPSASAVSRIVILEHFGELGHEAQNALLKTLEEPPLNTVIILTIENSETSLPTIVSRLQLFEVGPVSYEKVQGYFKDVPGSELQKAYNISNGSVGLLTSILEDDRNHPLLQAIELSKEVLRQPKFKRLGMVDKLTKNKDLPLVTFLDGTCRLLHASLHQALSVSAVNTQTAVQSNHRLKLVLNAMDDLQNGAGQKLVLTRLFLAL